jgi:G3E family GTPase
LSAAARLCGGNIARITNDQASNLVDTAELRRGTAAVREIAGSCFCCGFEALASHAVDLRNGGAEAVLAEPVGSCTDLVATVIRPFEARYGDDFAIAPLSVVVDPRRLERIVFNPRRRNLHGSAAYIYVKQLEEADVIVLNKIDTIDAATRDRLVRGLETRFPHARVRCTSARTGWGVSAWLELLEDQTLRRGRALDLDYDRYAEGEAILGWLNAAGSVTAETPQDWGEWLAGFMETVRSACAARRMPVGHVKALVRVGEEQSVVNLTSSAGEVVARGTVPASTRAEVILNARVQTAPDDLERLVRAASEHASRVTVHLDELRCFSPPRPVPTYRLADSQQVPV